jgi:hypothetical protein
VLGGWLTTAFLAACSFASSAALVVGAAEDDRPKIKGLFWVVLVFGRA